MTIRHRDRWNVEVFPLTNRRLRLASAILGLVSLGLLLSLLPRTSFVARPAGDIVDAVGPVWPEQSVEQVLDDGLGVVSEIRIWGAAGVGRGGEAPVVAALLHGPDRELVRQVRVGIKASHLLQPYLLEFAPYAPVPGEVLILQLWVTDERRNHAIFGTTEAGGEGGGPTLNLNATDLGPLAYEVIWRGDGWRAALAGSRLDLMRLAGGIAAGAVAVLLSPPVARRTSQALRKLRLVVRVVGRLIGPKLRSAGQWLAPPQGLPGAPASKRRALYVYPWLIPAFAILHYLANNLFLLRAYEAIVPSIVIMAGATAVLFTLRFVLGGAAPAALFTGILGTIFFSYGHFYVAELEQPDRRYLLGIGVPLLVGVAMLLRGRLGLSHQIGRVLNIATIVLVAFPIFQLGHILVSTASQPDRDSEIIADSAPVGDRAGPDRPSTSADDIRNDILTNPVVIDARHTQIIASIDPSEMRDIYYIILDAYPRSGAIDSFDNSAFVEQLEKRGFYVDPQARSNYTCTVASISSSTNMSYFRGGSPCGKSQADQAAIYNVALDHDLGRILTSLGYNYIHVSSGWPMTATSRNADQIVDFTPQGRVMLGHRDYERFFQWHRALERGISLSNRFMANFGKTTLINAFRDLYDYESEDRYTYGPWHPHRIQDWLDYMNERESNDEPTFVFAHLLKPHPPYSFDQDGNIAFDAGWTDEHDPRVESAFHGQVIWLNDRMLELIDNILARSRNQPIIVIAGDHGRSDDAWAGGDASAILAAYLLPEGGQEAIYQSITSVNVFRAILNFYFHIELEILRDEVFLGGD